MESRVSLLRKVQALRDELSLSESCSNPAEVVRESLLQCDLESSMSDGNVLLALLVNAPDSIHPERVLSVLADTFDDDQRSTFADYMELDLKLQFNQRYRSKSDDAVSILSP